MAPGYSKTRRLGVPFSVCICPVPRHPPSTILRLASLVPRPGPSSLRPKDRLP
ncbi:hypothetical protein BO71DRAFT_394122 [Aspergillus ellipticus CBS 707.79]|uniref:Uncharacterized protein n=1 Tax=Aspergillus ellipticus CBS 707.79 TaxID=1448320 RepID=A0A319EFS7_9EURO|nr:hypothetical protein BO71DRAFT_394122 [Aspergillus ellipticus CBS 707.79]